MKVFIGGKGSLSFMTPVWSRRTSYLIVVAETSDKKKGNPAKILM